MDVDWRWRRPAYDSRSVITTCCGATPSGLSVFSSSGTAGTVSARYSFDSTESNSSVTLL